MLSDDCVATIAFLEDVNHRHERIKKHCNSEQSVKFEKYGWKNGVLSAYLMRGVFHSTGLVEFDISCAKYFAPFLMKPLNYLPIFAGLMRGILHATVQKPWFRLPASPLLKADKQTIHNC